MPSETKLPNIGKRVAWFILAPLIIFSPVKDFCMLWWWWGLGWWTLPLMPLDLFVNLVFFFMVRQGLLGPLPEEVAKDQRKEGAKADS